MKNYKTPILTWIFGFAGVLDLLGAIVFMMISHSRDAESSPTLVPTYIIALAMISSGVVCLGIAQAIDFLGRTAHSTEDLCVLVEESQPQVTSAQTALAIQRLCTLIETSVVSKIQSIEQRLSSSTPILVQLDKIPASTPPPDTPKTVKYYYSTDGTQQGPYTASELKEYRSNGVIADKTSVFRKGDSEWRTFRDFPELTGT